MDGNHINLILAFVLMMAVMLSWQYFVVAPQVAKQSLGKTATHQLDTHWATTQRQYIPKAAEQRIRIETPVLDGSLLLQGARFDDVKLKQYRTTTDPQSPEVTLLSPQGSEQPYYASIGFTSDNGIQIPNDASIWSLSQGSVLAPGKPVSLEWRNEAGLVFVRRISVDANAMFTITDTVRNMSAAPVSLYPYAYIAREGMPKSAPSHFVHTGFIGVANGELKDESYSAFKDTSTPPDIFQSVGGWVGITDQYWMAVVIPPQDENIEETFRAIADDAVTTGYRAEYRLGGRVVQVGKAISVTHRLFAGPKTNDALEFYEVHQNVPQFDKAIDWGWFAFLTKPLFWLLHLFNRVLGNFGLAILSLTVAMKLLLLPLANMSFRSAKAMKDIQPRLTEIRTQFVSNKERQQLEIAALYKSARINPLTGCLFPMVVQLPLFLSLLTVLYVSIEMYHAPFYGWIHDLSASDPTSVLNLFGLLPYSVPHAIPTFLSIGAWPVLWGITQWIQAAVNGAPADPAQAKIFAVMPLVFTLVYASLPVGLVIYYTWSNILSAAQQYLFMRLHRTPVNFLDNLAMPRGAKNLLRRRGGGLSR